MKDLLVNEKDYDTLSPFGKFIIDTKDYDLVSKSGNTVDKWEAFELGFTNIKRLLNGEYKVKAKRKPLNKA
jgi:hypothetical protein